MAALFVIASPSALADTTIGSTGSATFGIHPFGVVGGYDLGESFASPGGNLSSFTFSSVYNVVGSSAEFVVAPLTGTTPGTPLYSRQVNLVTGSNTMSNLNVATTLGTEYLAYLTTFNVTGDAVADSYFGANSSYAGGGIYNLNDNVNPTGSVFNGGYSDYNLLFSATFTPAVAATPEPSSLLLLATGMLAGVGVITRRRVSLTA